MKNKAKGKFNLSVIIGVAVAIVLVLVFFFILTHFKSCGVGLGPGDGEEGGGSSSESGYNDDVSPVADNKKVSSETSAITSTLSTTIATTMETIQEIKISVYDKTYIYNGDTYDDVDTLMDELSSITSRYTVLILDNKASRKACRELIEALDSNKITHTGPIYD